MRKRWRLTANWMKAMYFDPSKYDNYLEQLGIKYPRRCGRFAIKLVDVRAVLGRHTRAPKAGTEIAELERRGPRKDHLQYSPSTNLVRCQEGKILLVGRVVCGHPTVVRWNPHTSMPYTN